MEDAPANQLLSSQKSPDSSLQVALHPLPILEISDYMTRAYMRGQDGAIVGALLGQQHGREITIEHSFTCKTVRNDLGQDALDGQWFADRLDQMKLVHKTPPLDLVGWYTLVPKSGPNLDHLPIHEYILRCHNESAVLLGFHVDDALEPAAGDPLPLTLYESNLEAEDGSRDKLAAEGEDKEMRDPESAPKMVLRFRELAFATETGDAEMIAMQFIRAGGANATAEVASKPSSKGKQRAQPEAKRAGDAILSREESEHIAALQAKASAIKMMKARVDLVISYLRTLPPEASAGVEAPAAEPTASGVVPSNNILRQIQALVTNAELLTPAQQATLAQEMLQESNDVTLISLVKDILSSVNEMREAGRKFAVVEAARSQKPRGISFDPAGSKPLSLGAGGDLLNLS